MKILIVCSKFFYDKLPEIETKLKNLGHEVVMPNCWDCPETESKFRGTEEHHLFKAKMFAQSENTIKDVDGILVLNYDKNEMKNYIGGATFLEIYDAFRLNKKIFFMNDLPDGMLKDELIGLNPTVIHEDLTKIDGKATENPYKILLDSFGEEIQFQFAIEEMGELLQAICKYKRKRISGDEDDIKKATENLQEEIADVIINMEQLSYMFGQEEIDKIKQEKLERALKRAEKHNLEII